MGCTSAERLVDEGAPERERGEAWRDYVVRATRSFRRVRHPGNHVYVWALGHDVTFSREAKAFPKERINHEI